MSARIIHSISENKAAEFVLLLLFGLVAYTEAEAQSFWQQTNGKFDGGISALQENPARHHRFLYRGTRYLDKTQLNALAGEGFHRDEDDLPWMNPVKWLKQWEYFSESLLHEQSMTRLMSHANFSPSSSFSLTNSFGEVDTAWVRHFAAPGPPSIDIATAIAVDNSGNVYLTGYSTGTPFGMHYLTIKYNSAGAKIWEARYNGPGNADDLAAAIAVDEAGNVYVTGVSYDANTSDDYATVKYNAAGVEQWVARYNGPANLYDEATALALDAAGNIYVTGRSWGAGSADDFATIKYNSAGAQQWATRYNGAGNPTDVPVDLAVDAGGNVYVTGWSWPTTGGGRYATVKYNSAGVQQWAANYAGPANGNDAATGLALDNAGNVYVTGRSVSVNTSFASFDYGTVKYNNAGVEQWVARYHQTATSHEEATALAVDPVSGDVYVTGISDGTGTNADYVTIKYNTAGVEQWVARYIGPGNSRNAPSAVILDAAGNVYVTGEGESNTGASDDYATIKYNSAGVQQWATRFNRPGNYLDKPPALAVDGAGNVYVSGLTVGTTSSLDYAAIKHNSSGSIQWVVSYDGPHKRALEQVADVAVDAAGNVYVTGFSLNASDYLTVKYNSAGALQWTVRYDAGGGIPVALAVDAEGNVYVTGRSRVPGSASDYATIKYNSAGVQQWVARYNRPGNDSDVPSAFILDAAGNIYVTGSSRALGPDYDYTTIKYNNAGVEQWVAHYNGPADSTDLASALAVDAAGNVYVTGQSRGTGTDYDYATIKYNSVGAQQWVARYNGPGNSLDEAVALASDAAGNVYVTGRSRGFNTDYDYATIKYDAAGVQQWVARYNGVANNWDEATALGIDNAGNLYVTGWSWDDFTKYDYVTIKYASTGAQQWLARYNGPESSFDGATDLAIDADGNVYVTGYVGHGKVLRPGSTLITGAFATLKYNGAGVEQWAAFFDGPGSQGDFPVALAVDAAKNVYVTGVSEGIDLAWSIYTTIKYDQGIKNRPPVVANAISDQTLNTCSAQFARNLNASPLVFNDPDGDTLTYTVSSSDTNIAKAAISESILTVTPVAPGSAMIAVTASDKKGGTMTTKFTITIKAKLPPGITQAPISPQSSGQQIQVQSNITDDTVVVNVTLNYRRGGDPSFTSLAMTETGGSYRGFIPASAASSRGVEYYIEATNQCHLTTRSDIFSIQVIVPEPGVVKDSAQPNGNSQTAYRLISVPLDLDNKNAKAVLEDDLGKYDDTKWRFSELPANQTYAEISDATMIDPGKAFWLLVKDGGKMIGTGAGKSNVTSRRFAIPLHPAWNFVANPFNFPIPATNLSLQSGKPLELRSYSDAWNDPSATPVDMIVPFEGYAVFNELSIFDTLLVNPDLASSDAFRYSQLSNAQPLKGQLQTLWSIRILAQCQQARDVDNLAAIVAGAEIGFDVWDRPEPPPVGEYVSVNFPHRDWAPPIPGYCVDARPEFLQGEIWEFEVATNIRDKVNLTFEGVAQVPPEFAVWLVDEALNISQNLRENDRYAVAGTANPKRLKMVVGHQSFVAEKLGEGKFVPTTYELSQNFPNPFNPVTTIRYGLPKGERVTLKIFNLLGEEVVTLVGDEQKEAGYHAAIWNGRNAQGRAVASGVYFYQLRAGSFVQRQKMALMR